LANYSLTATVVALFIWHSQLIPYWISLLAWRMYHKDIIQQGF